MTRYVLAMALSKHRGKAAACLNKYPVAVVEKKISEAQKPSLTDVNTSTIILVANVMINPTETSWRDMAFQYRKKFEAM